MKRNFIGSRWPLSFSSFAFAMFSSGSLGPMLSEAEVLSLYE
jgi:hypothetical protein